MERDEHFQGFLPHLVVSILFKNQQRRAVRLWRVVPDFRRENLDKPGHNRQGPLLCFDHELRGRPAPALLHPRKEPLSGRPQDCSGGLGERGLVVEEGGLDYYY